MPEDMPIHKNQARTYKRRVYFNGNTRVEKGQLLCYDRDYGTATSLEGERDKRVEVASSSNNKHVAGASANAYPATSNGQWIEINEPGSVCEILCGIATTVNTGRVTATVTGKSGMFLTGGLPGRGSALPLQTSATASATINAGPLFSNLDGSGAFTTSSKSLAKTAAFANAVAGDKVLVLGGTGVTAAEYTINSVTSANAAVLTADIGGTNPADVAFIVYRGKPTVLAYLETGDESGLTEFVTPLGAATTAAMVGGKTFVCKTTIATSDHIPTVADATRIGLRKQFECLGTLTTNDYLITITTGIAPKPGGSNFDAWQALATVEFDAAADFLDMHWDGLAWVADRIAGATVA